MQKKHGQADPSNVSSPRRYAWKGCRQAGKKEEGQTTIRSSKKCERKSISYWVIDPL